MGLWIGFGLWPYDYDSIIPIRMSCPAYKWNSNFEVKWNTLIHITHFSTLKFVICDDVGEGKGGGLMSNVYVNEEEAEDGEGQREAE